MKFIKHKNMRDVCAQILEERTSIGEPYYRFKVLWINTLGMFESPEPFPIGTGSQLAIEDIHIVKETFEKEWEVRDEP